MNEHELFQQITADLDDEPVNTEHLLQRTVVIGNQVIKSIYLRNDRVRAVMKLHQRTNPDKPLKSIRFNKER